MNDAVDICSADIQPEGGGVSLTSILQLHQGVCPRRLWPHQTQHVRAAEDGHGHPGAGRGGDDPVGSGSQLESVLGMTLIYLSSLFVCQSVDVDWPPSIPE